MNTRAWLCTGALSMLLTAPVKATEPSADTAPTVSSLSGRIAARSEERRAGLERSSRGSPDH